MVIGKLWIGGGGGLSATNRTALRPSTMGIGGSNMQKIQTVILNDF